jgi:hypothetical protein
VGDWLSNPQKVFGWAAIRTKAIQKKDKGRIILSQQGCVTRQICLLKVTFPKKIMT